MIIKNSDRILEVRENMRGGPGKVLIKHYFKKDQINAPCRLCAELILAPGSGIGAHEHIDEDEIFVIQRGRGIVIDDGKEVEVAAGDAILTGKGGSHSIRNTGDVDLIVTAHIVRYNS